ncbi:MAG: sigma-E processing peptidase SpoIIGA, partial [Lachnospiraceae bacterium]
MDFLLLAVLRFILKYPFRPLRMLLGAGAGALWACVAAVFPVFPRILEMAVTYILVSGLMLWVSFGLTGIRELIKGIIGLYLSAVMLGGMMYALYQTGFFIQYGAEAIPMIILMLLALGSYFGIRFLWGITEETRKRRKYLCQVRLHYQDQEITVTALLDTGNQ